MYPDLTTWLTLRELTDMLQQRLPTVNVSRYLINKALDELGCVPRPKPTDQKTYVYAPEWVEPLIAYMRSGYIMPDIPFAKP